MSDPTETISRSISESDLSNVPGQPSVDTNALSRKPLRLLIPGIMVVLYWIVVESSHRLEMGMFYRFITRAIALLVLMLFFLVWGMTRRHFTFGQRCLALGMIVGAMFAAGAIGHATMGVPSMAMMGLPLVITLSAAWLWWARRGSARYELAGIGVVVVAVFGLMTLLRWDGLDGRQRAEISWRWTPNAEDQFQQSLRETSGQAAEQATLQELPGDWPSFRGGVNNSTVHSIELSDWAQSPPREIWRRRVGPGWSSVISVGNYLFTQEQRGDREAIVCYHSETGQETWVHSADGPPERFNEPLSGSGPRGTPAFHDGRIYACGAKGRLTCLDAATGKSLWVQSVTELAAAKIPQWGVSTSPAIVDDNVVVFAGGPDDKGLIAFHRITGEKSWQTAAGAISYSTPQVFTVGGKKQIVMHDDSGLAGIQIEDGKRLWFHASPHAGTFQPMLQPHLIAEDRFLVGWDSGVLCIQVEPGSWQTKELWASTRLKPSFNDFVIHKNHAFGLDDGILACIELSGGRRIWKQGRYGFGQLLLLPDIDELLVLSEQGEVVRVAADVTKFREISRFQAIEGKTWNHPTLTRGRLIVRNSEEMACFELAQAPAIARSLEGAPARQTDFAIAAITGSIQRPRPVKPAGSPLHESGKKHRGPVN